MSNENDGFADEEVNTKTLEQRPFSESQQAKDEQQAKLYQTREDVGTRQDVSLIK